VQRVAKVQLDDHLAAPNLCCKSAQTSLVGIGRRAQRQLVAKVAGKGFPEANGSLLIKVAVLLDESVSFGKLLLRKGLHANEQAAAFPVPTSPLFDVLVELTPSPEIEVPDAEISPMRDAKGGLEGRQELLVDIVENTGHFGAEIRVECNGVIWRDGAGRTCRNHGLVSKVRHKSEPAQTGLSELR
jgi:hypothetical protein